MGITLSKVADPQFFTGTHYVVIELPGQNLHWILTGQAILSFKGTGPNWKNEKVQLILDLPGIGENWVKLSGWAPFVTLNALRNDSHAVNAGWSVSSFRVLGAETASPAINVECDIAVRDIDGYILGLGYVVHAVGSLVKPPAIS